MKLPFTNPKSFPQFLLETLGLALTTALLMVAVEQNRENMSPTTYKTLLISICLIGMTSSAVNSFFSDLNKKPGTPNEKTPLLSAESPRPSYS